MVRKVFCPGQPRGDNLFWWNVNACVRNNLPFRGEAEDIAGVVALGIISATLVGIVVSIPFILLNSK